MRDARGGDDRGSPSENGEKEIKTEDRKNNTTSCFDVRDVPSLTLSFSVSSLAAEHLGNKAVKAYCDSI